MSKIVFLQSKGLTDALFKSEYIDEIKKMGDVVINEECEDPDADRVIELIGDADIAITSWGCPAFDEKVLSNAPDLKAVIHAAGSVKPLVTPELWQRGIRVCSSARALSKGVAETALGLTIASLKNMWKLSRGISEENGWESPERKNIKELFDITIGVIGAGYAGKHYIRLLNNFDVEILLYDPFVSEERAKDMGAVKTGLEELLKKSDVVSIHAPSLPDTDKMINKERLLLMKDDAILINTARGSIIDETALIEELRKGRLFACLDVTEPEPPSPDNPLIKLPNVIMTPHIAGAVNNGRYRVGRQTVDNVKRFLAGQEMDGEIVAGQMGTIA